MMFWCDAELLWMAGTDSVDCEAMWRGQGRRTSSIGYRQGSGPSTGESPRHSLCSGTSPSPSILHSGDSKSESCTDTTEWSLKERESAGCVFYDGCEYG